jgi:hypothetical protein
LEDSKDQAMNSKIMSYFPRRTKCFKNPAAGCLHLSTPVQASRSATMGTANLSDSRQTEVLVVAWVMTSAAILTVCVKLFARVKIIRVVGWDDFFIIM